MRWIDTHIKSIHMSKIEIFRNQLDWFWWNQSNCPKMMKLTSQGVIIPYKVKIIQNNNWKVPKSITLIQKDLLFWIISNISLLYNRGKTDDRCALVGFPQKLYRSITRFSGLINEKHTLMCFKCQSPFILYPVKQL